MKVMSVAFLSQCEVTQVDRWKYGPLEIRFVPEPDARRALELGGRVIGWNQSQCSGFLRDAEDLESLRQMGILTGDNPNLVLAPTRHGYSELLGMLGSLLPDDRLTRYDIERPSANFWLWPLSEAIGFRKSRMDRHFPAELDGLTEEYLRRLAARIPRAFEEWIWTRLVRNKRFGMQDFSKDSSLRLLAGDCRFWMHRLYRVAIELYESRPPTSHRDDGWKSLKSIRQQMNRFIPKDRRSKFRLARPRVGGDIWDPDDPRDREDVTEMLINGDETTDSLQPVVETLLGSAAHEDFSERHSWIREDFERAFYSKRSKIKIKYLESVDECAVFDGADTPGYHNLLFRDLMAFFDHRDRAIIVALRQGKTRSEIAEELGHSGHAAVSRRIKRIGETLRRILRNE